MPSRQEPPPETGKRNSKVERALLLRDAVEHSARAEQEIATKHSVRRSRAAQRMLTVLCIGGIGFCAWSFIARPAFIWGTGASPIPPQRAEAGVRLAMYLQARRLDLYREREGAYPDALGEVGGDTTIDYRRADDTAFVLTATAAGRVLVLKSADDREAFLGNSRDLVQQRVGR